MTITPGHIIQTRPRAAYYRCNNNRKDRKINLTRVACENGLASPKKFDSRYIQLSQAYPNIPHGATLVIPLEGAKIIEN